MSNRTYQVDEQAFESATINLSQVSAMLGMLAQNGDDPQGFTSTEMAVQVIFGAQQMIDEAKQKLKSGFKGIAPDQTIEPEPLTSGM
jgi:hypothetical protein